MQLKVYCDEENVSEEDYQTLLSETIYFQNEVEKDMRRLRIKSIDDKVYEKIPGQDFWVPKYEYQLRNWIKDYCEGQDKALPKGFSKMRKKQLYAIYFSIMKS